MADSLAREAEEALLALEFAISGGGGAAAVAPHAPLDTDASSFAASTLAASNAAVRAAQLTVPATSAERSRLVAAARLRAQQRGAKLQKAGDGAADALARPIKLPAVLEHMRVPRSPLPPPLPPHQPHSYALPPAPTQPVMLLAPPPQAPAARPTPAQSVQDAEAFSALKAASHRQTDVLRELQRQQEAQHKEQLASQARERQLLQQLQQHLLALQPKRAIAPPLEPAPAQLATPAPSPTAGTARRRAGGISVPLTVIAKEPSAASRRLPPKIETVVVPIVVAPIVAPASPKTSMRRRPQPSLLPQQAAASEVLPVPPPPPSPPPATERETTLASLLQLMWEDVLRLLPLSPPPQSAQAHTHVSDDTLLALLMSALMRSELTSGRAHAHSLRDSLVGVQQEVANVAVTVRGLEAAGAASAREAEALAGRCVSAVAAAEEARSAAALVASEAAARAEETERRVAASLAGMRQQVAATAMTLAEVVATAHGSGEGGSVAALSEASTQLLVREAVEREVGGPVRELASGLADLRDQLEGQRKGLAEAAARLSASGMLAPGSEVSMAAGAGAPQLAQLGEEVARLRADLAELHARRDVASALREVSRDGSGNGEDDDGEGDDSALPGLLPRRLRDTAASAFVALRLDGTAPEAWPRGDRGGDLSVGEVLLSDEFEEGAAVRLFPLS